MDQVKDVSGSRGFSDTAVRTADFVSAHRGRLSPRDSLLGERRNLEGVLPLAYVISPQAPLGMSAHVLVTRNVSRETLASHETSAPLVIPSLLRGQNNRHRKSERRRRKNDDGD